jgi:hypothetical protein
MYLTQGTLSDLSAQASCGETTKHQLIREARNNLMSLKHLALLAAFFTSVAPAQLKSGAYTPGQLANVPGEAVIVNKFGVYPQKIVRTEGPFLLYVLNRQPGHTEHFFVTLDQDNAAEKEEL